MGCETSGAGVGSGCAGGRRLSLPTCRFSSRPSRLFFAAFAVKGFGVESQKGL